MGKYVSIQTQETISVTEKAIRIIYNLNYHDHTSVFFHSSKVLKRHDFVTYKTMIILNKANNHSLNGRVHAFFKQTEAIHMYGTRQSKLFYVKKNKHHPQTTVTHCQRYKDVEQFSNRNNSATNLTKHCCHYLQHIYELLIESYVN